MVKDKEQKTMVKKETTPATMNLPEARKLAREQMEKHGVGDWNFEFNQHKTYFGLCRCGLETIALSQTLVLINNRTRVLKTILHEIAHALAYKFCKHTGHGEAWKRYCVKLGIKPNRCAPQHTTKKPSGKYEAICKNCGFVWTKHRMKKRDLHNYFCTCQDSKKEITFLTWLKKW